MLARRTKLTPEFSAEDLRAEYGDDFVPPMAAQDKTVAVATLDAAFAPGPGWTVLRLVLEG